MLLAKSFTIPVELVVKPAAQVTTSQKPFCDPGASTSSLARGSTGPSLVQATDEAVDEMQTATQPLEAPGAETATQPVQAPGSVPDVQPSSEGDLSAASDSEGDQHSVTGSLSDENYRCRSPDRDLPREEAANQVLSEEANYRETMRGIRSFMGWDKIPEFETVSSSDDNPFAVARVQPTGKVSVKLPVSQGYPARNTDTAGLLKDKFIKPPRSFRWYGMHTEKNCESNTVSTWSPELAKLNHSFSWVARRNLPSAPPYRAFSQDMLRNWVMCNQAADLSRCLTRVQDAMSAQLKTLHLDKKGKSSERTKQAIDELDYLVTFNRSISQAMARTMQDLPEGVFTSMSNFILAHRDSYLEYLHASVKQDTLNALRTSPVHLNSLFPDQLITKAEEEICRSEERRSAGQPHRYQGRFHPYASSDKSASHPDRKSGVPTWKQIRDKQQSRKGRGKASTFSQKPAKGYKPRKSMCKFCDRSEELCLCYRSDRLEPTFSCSRGRESDFKFECRLLCCKCSYCHRVATKERHKSHLLSNVHRNKICERCFLCRSLVFCKSCHRCPTCCHQSTCRGKVTQVLGEVGSSGFESKSSHHTEGGLHTPLPVQIKLDQVTNCNKQLPQSSQTGQPFRGTVSAGEHKCSRTGRKSKLSGILQPAIFGTQTQQLVETYPGPEHLEHLFEHLGEQKCSRTGRKSKLWDFTTGYFWYPNPTTGGDLSWT